MCLETRAKGFAGGGGALGGGMGMRKSCPKTLFFLGNSATKKRKTCEFYCQKFCCHFGGSHLSLREVHMSIEYLSAKFGFHPPPKKQGPK